MEPHNDLLGRILQSPRLTSLPTIALKVIDLAQQPEVEFRHIAEAIQHDPGLSTKILKTVNSPFYGQAREISTVSRALQLLGLNSVKTLALGFSLVGNLKKSQGRDFDHVAYWRRSLYAARGPRGRARRRRLLHARGLDATRPDPLHRAGPDGIVKLSRIRLNRPQRR